MRRVRNLALALALAVGGGAGGALLGACGKGGNDAAIDAAPPIDALGVDGSIDDTDAGVAPPPVDAGVDAAPPPTEPPSSALDLTAGAGRVRGGGLILDVQIGHGTAQTPVRGGGRVLGGAPAVAP